MGEGTSTTSWKAVAFAATVSSCTAATLGYDVGIMADAIDLIRDTLELETWATQLIVGSLNFTSAFGTLIAGQTSDYLGRKKTVLICCLLYIVGTFCMTVAQSFGVLLVGRIVTGLGVGVSFVVTPVYITEISPASARGMLSTCFDISINAGIVLGYIVGFAIISQEFVTGKEARWRLMLALGAALPLFVAGSLAFLPESPRWLHARGRADEALDVLVRFLGDRAEAEAVMRDMEEAEGGGGANQDLVVSSSPPPPSSSSSSSSSSPSSAMSPFHSQTEALGGGRAAPSPSSSSSKNRRGGSRSSNSNEDDEAAAALGVDLGEDEDFEGDESGGDYESGRGHSGGRDGRDGRSGNGVGGGSGGSGGSGDESMTWRQLLLLDPLPESEEYLRGVVMTVIGIGFWQQASGSEAVLYYSSTFLEKAGLTSVRQRLGGYILIGMCKLVPEAVVMCYVDRIGRRPMVVASALGVTATIFTLACAFLVDPTGDNPATAVAVVCLLSVYMLCFSLGMGPVTWLLAAEMLPLRARAKGMMACCFINRLTSGTVALSALSTCDALGFAGFFLLYGSVAALGAGWYYRRLTETKGRSLESITEEFRARWEAYGNRRHRHHMVAASNTS